MVVAAQTHHILSLACFTLEMKAVYSSEKKNNHLDHTTADSKKLQLTVRWQTKQAGTTNSHLGSNPGQKLANLTENTLLFSHCSRKM
jgi:hypothetical protein